MEAPFVFYKRKNMKKSAQKKLHSHFQSEPGFEPTDLQNDKFLQTYALAHAATELYIN